MNTNTFNCIISEQFNYLQEFAKKPRLFDRMDAVMFGQRHFFVSEDEMYGLSEQGAEGGDIPALLFLEHFFPFVQRKCGEHYRIIAAAYMPCILRDEIRSQSEQDLSLSTFTIT
jgi:hypothetical protein